MAGKHRSRSGNVKGCGMPAGRGDGGWHGGRRPQASREGTRGTPHERWELNALYGDLGGTADRSGWV